MPASLLAKFSISSLATITSSYEIQRHRSIFSPLQVAFDNIVSDDPEYTVTISTELNGRTVTQMVEKFPVGSPQDGEEEAAAAAPNDGDDRPGEEGGGGVFVKEKVGNT